VLSGSEAAGWTDALDERLQLRRSLRSILDKPLPEGVSWYHCFGGMTFFTFVVLVVLWIGARMLLGTLGGVSVG